VVSTFLAPGRDVLVDASIVTGRVIGGGGTDTNSNSMSVHSTSTINFVPEPTTLSRVALGSLALTMQRRRRA
jgi:hypothetical protein